MRRLRLGIPVAALLAAGCWWSFKSREIHIEPSPDESVESRAETHQGLAAVEQWEHARRLAEQSEPLSGEEIEELCRFMENGRIPVGISRNEAAALKNDVMNRLGCQALSERYLALLVKLQADVGQPDVIRDYAIQHLSAWTERFPDLNVVRQTFWQRSQDERGSAGATALLALRRMEQEGKLAPEDRLQLLEVSHALVLKKEVADATRMVAMEILRGQGDRRGLEAARQILVENSSVALTVAAVGAMGVLGDTSDLECLERLLARGEPAFAAVLRKSIETLKWKTNL